jgi:hypothetical protein
MDLSDSVPSLVVEEVATAVQGDTADGSESSRGITGRDPLASMETFAEQDPPP